MLVKFDVKDERQKKLLVECMNLTKVPWQETNSDEVDLLMNTDPLILLVAKLTKEMLINMVKDSSFPFALDNEQATLVLQGAICRVQPHLLVELEVIEKAILDEMRTRGLIE